MFSDQLKADCYVMIDGDDTYDIARLPEMLDMVLNDGYDMVVGKRIHTKSDAYRAGHVLGNKFFSKFVNLFFGNDLSDIFSGFRVFSKRFIKTFPLISQEFEIEAELTIHALEQKLSIAEVNCNYNRRLENSES